MTKIALTVRRLFRRFRKEAGNAIIISIIMMGLLMFLGIGVNALIIRELRITRHSVNAEVLYYVAESGVEMGLLAIDEEDVGYEEEQDVDNFGAVTVGPGQLEYDLTYVVQGTGESNPLEDRGNDPDDADRNVLQPNESVTIPLFDESGNGDKVVDNFTVDFTYPPVATVGSKVRWKVFALTNKFDGTADRLGTVAVSGLLSGSDKNLSSNDNGTHEYETRSYNVHFNESWPISIFLRSPYEKPYLMLTNISDQDISYVMADKTGDVVLQRPVVTGTATLGNNKQQVQVDISLPTMLPVFDFALFETK